MIPEFLQPFETALKAYQREYVAIEASPTEDSVLSDPLPVKQSKFLGKPFLPVGRTYPRDKSGKAMPLLTQLNFSQIPPLEFFPKKGILQLYLADENWYDDEYKVVFIREDELEVKPQTEFSFLNEILYDELPVHKIHRLEFVKKTENGGTEDSQFNMTFNRLDFWDFHETLNEEQQKELLDYFDGAGHKLGGYAEFTQSDPRDCDSSKSNDIQLLQIDVDDFIMFGDSGLGHIFISLEDLQKRDFEQAYFYWDCC